MGAMLTQHDKPICYHSDTFNLVVVNYPTYDKELYALVQSVKKWKHYLMGKETVYILIIRDFNIYTPKLSCNNQDITDGWVFYNSFT